MEQKKFMRRVMEGERDFTGDEITTTAGHWYFEFDESCHRSLREYLKSQDMQFNPVILEESKCYGLLLPKAYLPHFIGTKANFAYSYFRDADMRGADLIGANLTRAYLEGANLEGAYLMRANLEGANLIGANLEGAYLIGANLEGAYLTGANLTEANLYGARKGGAIF